jgi:sarcosine oxidase subunit alpha
MTAQPFRRITGGVIDRSRPVTFTFDGREYAGFAGDTLASALLANGVRVVARSFKLHRPRGIMAAGAEEANAFVSLGEGAYLDTNLRTTQIEIYQGLKAQSLNAWPSVNFDVSAVLDYFSSLLPSGFYYKTFMWPNWHVFEGFVRRAAGLGTPARVADPDRYDQTYAHCDLLVVGSGPAGLMAAYAGAMSGTRVILAEQEPDFGGSLQGLEATMDGQPAREWVAGMIQRLKALPTVTLLPRTTVSGYYDGNSLVAFERLTDHLPLAEKLGRKRQRLWKIEAARVVLATGAIERPMVFPDNDRPGIMALAAMRRYLCQYGVAAGRRVAVFANNDGAYGDAAYLAAAGIEVAALIDSRGEPGAAVRALAEEAGIKVISGAAITRVYGVKVIRAIDVEGLDGGSRQRIACDAIGHSGGWNPAVHLFCQSDGKLVFNEKLASFVPGKAHRALQSAGAAAGDLGLAACLGGGLAAGQAAVKALGRDPVKLVPPFAHERYGVDYALEPFWAVPEYLSGGRRQWVDFHNDVTTRDVALAARENFTSVEHLKRYTTLGMALDQGKTANVNGLAIMGELTGRAPAEVGTTTFRPPYTPVTFGAITGARRGGMFSPLRHLPTHDSLMQLGAGMRDYGGWLRPSHFPQAGEAEQEAITREILAVRGGVGMTDYSPLGKIEVKGPDAAHFLNHMVLTDVTTIGQGRGRYSLMINERGIVIDDGIITRLGDDHFLLGTTSGGALRMAASLEEWLQGEWPDMQVFVANVTTAWGVILVSGPRARELVARLGSDIDFSGEAFPHMAFRTGFLDGMGLRVHRVSFTGEISYEIAIPAGYTASLWQRLLALGEDLGVTPFGLESLLVMRLEKGFIHVGSDTDGTTLPGDIGYGAVAAKKTFDYVGKRSLMQVAALRVDRLQLVGLAPVDGGSLLPVGGHLLKSSVRSVPAASEGYVTSSALSPALGRPVALGLLQAGRSRMGEDVRVYANGAWVEAKVVAPAFYDPQGEKINA